MRSAHLPHSWITVWANGHGNGKNGNEHIQKMRSCQDRQVAWETPNRACRLVGWRSKNEWVVYLASLEAFCQYDLQPGWETGCFYGME